MSNFRFLRNEQFPPIVKNLIIINVLVFAAHFLLKNQFNVVNNFALWPVIPASLKEALLSRHFIAEDFGLKPYQLITHMFTHSAGSFTHILFNMFGLWMFGKTLENFWGGKRFLLFYFACGLGAAVCHLVVQYLRSYELLEAINTANEAGIAKYAGALAPTVGASGAVMGIFAAFAYLFPNTELFIMFIPVPVKAKWAVLALAAIDLFGGLANVSGDNIAHFAHLGGALVGFFLVLYWNKRNRKTFY
jgi:rhomboid-like protein